MYVKFRTEHAPCAWESITKDRLNYIFFHFKFLLYVWVCREMRKKKGGNDDGRRTKWPPLDVETRRRRGQIICKRWDMPSPAGKKNSKQCDFHLAYCTSSFSQESERLEMLNSDLKAQIEELKLERQQLILMLNRHRPTCIVRTDSVKTPESEGNPLLEQLEAKWRCIIILSIWGGGDSHQEALSFGLQEKRPSGPVITTEHGAKRLDSVQSVLRQNMRLNTSTGYSTFH